jgi:FKBP-type peptidyl-prolyl cis-trans isomerase FklB
MTSALTPSRPHRSAATASLLTLAAALLCSSLPAQAADAPALTNDADRNGYATGLMTARNLLGNKLPFNAEMIVQGLRDGLAGGPVRMTEQELRQVVQAMQAGMEKHLAEERQARAAANAERGNAFIENYRKQPGAIVLPGNIAYRILTPGTGDKPGERAKVVVKYTGSLVDGTVFDSTGDDKTLSFRLNEVIPGWTLVLQSMPTGSVWEVVIPPALAYGARGNTRIGPNETLVFKIELVAIAG